LTPVVMIMEEPDNQGGNDDAEGDPVADPLQRGV